MCVFECIIYADSSGCYKFVQILLIIYYCLKENISIDRIISCIDARETRYYAETDSPESIYYWRKACVVIIHILDTPCTGLYRKLMHIAESIVPCHTHIINYDDKNTKKRKHKKSSAISTTYIPSTMDMEKRAI